MNPQCARCGKVVYPTEKVNCLDKVLGRWAGGDGASRACSPCAALRSPQLRRGGPGRAGGGAGRAGRWQRQRLRGCRCAGIRAATAAGGRQPPCHRAGAGRRASGGRGGRAAAAAGRRAPALPARGVTAPGAGGGSPRPPPCPGSPRDEVVGGPRPAGVVGASPSWGGFGCPLRHGHLGGDGGRGSGVATAPSLGGVPRRCRLSPSAVAP